MQTRGGFAQGSLKLAAKKGNVLEALIAIGRQEGFRGYWKGNLPQVGLPKVSSYSWHHEQLINLLCLPYAISGCKMKSNSRLQVLKVIPYSATQLYAYESFKALLSHKDGSISVWARLAAGASAGMSATLVSPEHVLSRQE